MNGAAVAIVERRDHASDCVLVKIYPNVLHVVGNRSIKILYRTKDRIVDVFEESVSLFPTFAEAAEYLRSIPGERVEVVL